MKLNLKLKSKKIKNLSKDKAELQADVTPQVGGGYSNSIDYTRLASCWVCHITK